MLSLPTLGTWIEMMYGIVESRINTDCSPCGEHELKFITCFQSHHLFHRSPWKERELKFRRALVCRIRAKIALHAGSLNWNFKTNCNNTILSNCSQYGERELKFLWCQQYQCTKPPFPIWGTRIEIVVRLHINTIAPIALYTGSANWNLMFLLLLLLAKSRSPCRERELKFSINTF